MKSTQGGQDGATQPAATLALDCVSGGMQLDLVLDTVERIKKSREMIRETILYKSLN